MNDAKPPPSALARTLRLARAGAPGVLPIAASLIVVGAVYLMAQALNGVVTTASALLTPRVEQILTTSLNAARGQQQAFLVAFTYGGRKSLSDHETLRVFRIPLGKYSTRVEWGWSVDLGLDLRGSGADAFDVRCDEPLRLCTWHVPDPSARPPAIDTAKLTIDQETSVLVFNRVETRQREDVLRAITAATVAEVEAPEFQPISRELVRAGLRNLANGWIEKGMPGESPAVVEVLFASEVQRGRGAPLVVDAPRRE
jgi:hypothetical protein